METRVKEASSSVPELLRELRDETSFLIRQEVALAKTEMSQKATAASRHLTSLVIGGLTAFAGLLFLLWSATAGIRVALIAMEPTMEPHTAWLAPLIVGGLVALIGVILLVRAQKKLKHTSMVPEKTVQTLKEDKEWLSRKTA